jgi:hypothetical protein
MREMRALGFTLAEKDAVECTAVRRDRAHHEATKTR